MGMMENIMENTTIYWWNIGNHGNDGNLNTIIYWGNIGNNGNDGNLDG